MPCPRKGSMAGETGGGPESPPPGIVVSVLALDDLAALLGAVFLGRLHHALALARVLPGAGVAGAGARALALARVDPGAAHHVAAGLLVGRTRHASGEDQACRRRRQNHALRSHE